MSWLTLVFTTARVQPHLDWFTSSLANQVTPGEVEVLVVDLRHGETLHPHTPWRNQHVAVTSPKPTPWQGPHRVTGADWWAKSNACNTALCLVETPWVAFCDDRLVLEPGWVDAARRTRDLGVVGAGSYQKRSGLRVEGGLVADYGTQLARDHRAANGPRRNCGGSWLFGCNYVAPLEAMLRVNGLEEGCDGMGMEDSILGLNLQHAGYRIDFDPTMTVTEDRSVGEVENHSPDIKHTDKGTSPRDKSHAALDRFGKRDRTEFTPDLRALRTHLRTGGNWPGVDPEARDWYDGLPVRDHHSVNKEDYR